MTVRLEAVAEAGDAGEQEPAEQRVEEGAHHRGLSCQRRGRGRRRRRACGAGAAGVGGRGACEDDPDHVEAVEADGGDDVDALLVADDVFDADDLADGVAAGEQLVDAGWSG
jgi:hypothetical protein